MSQIETPETTEAAPVEAAAEPTFLERWGPAAVVTILVLFAVEMAVLTPMVRYGVDLSSFLAWAGETFGLEVDTSQAGTSWWLALGVAYAITRGLKPVQLAVAVPLTPIVARVTGLGSSR